MLVGIAMHYLVPDFIGASSLAVAIVSGGASGLAATGSNQVFKQLMKSAQQGKLTLDTTTKPADEQTDRTE